MQEIHALINADVVAAYRADGFVRIPGTVARDEALAFQRDLDDFSRRESTVAASDVFDQYVNL